MRKQFPRVDPLQPATHLQQKGPRWTEEETSPKKHWMRTSAAARKIAKCFGLPPGYRLNSPGASTSPSPPGTSIASCSGGSSSKEEEEEKEDEPEVISTSSTSTYITSPALAPPPPPVVNSSQVNYRSRGSGTSTLGGRYYGSLFSQLRNLPTYQASGLVGHLPSSQSRLTPQQQHRKNLDLLHRFTDSGAYSRLTAISIASLLYHRRITEADIRAELSPKQKFAYKRFCLEIDDKLQSITRPWTGTSVSPPHRPLSERSLRKIWHLYALYTKTLYNQISDTTEARRN